jgi:hypothetical protein
MYFRWWSGGTTRSADIKSKGRKMVEKGTLLMKDQMSFEGKSNHKQTRAPKAPTSREKLKRRRETEHAYNKSI